MISGLPDPSSGAQSVSATAVSAGGFSCVHRLELEVGRDALPAAREPGGIRVATARDHDDRPVGKRGQQAPAHIPVERRHPLVRVDQDERLLAVSRQRQQRLERVRHRRELPPLDEERLKSARSRASGQLAQQRALADPAGAVDQDHARGRVVVQAALEERELRGAADEALTVTISHPRRQRAGSDVGCGWREPLLVHDLPKISCRTGCF